MTSRTEWEIDRDRRSFIRAAATSLAATQLGVITHAHANANETERRTSSARRPMFPPPRGLVASASGE